jgi:ubiquinone/menaquinone biosynthesis C-methylase UbiE
VLDVAPSNCIAPRWENYFGENYISVDLTSPLAKIKMDITNLEFTDNCFDWIICYHVLEHIPDDLKAMRELRRVLKGDGFAILQVPIFHGRTYEDPTVVTPEGREKAFGQSDHIRKYGSDYHDRLKQAGFTVAIDRYVKELGGEKINTYGLPEHEDIFLCTK